MNKPMDKTSKVMQKNGGQVIMGALLLFLTISITVLVGIATPVAIQVRTAADFLQSKQGYVSADVLNEEALYRLNKGRALPSSIVLSFNDSTSTALITDVNGSKQIIATGISGAFTRLSKSVFSQGEGLSIPYALQAGTGGIALSGSATINGNVISNGPITGSGVPRINGFAYAAKQNEQVPVFINSSASITATSFGTVNASQDIAQSFTLSTSTPLTKIMIYIKKVGSPADAHVRIVNNSSGSPAGSSGLIVSSTLNSTQVTGQYGWVPITIPTANLLPGNTYWLILDRPQNSAQNYYVLGTTNGNTYTGGLMKQGRYNVSNSWSAVNSNLDFSFELYHGGNSSIAGAIVSGNASAYSVTYASVSGTLYCQYGNGNNKQCNTASSTPASLAYPFSETNIVNWKAEATAGGVYTGNLTLNNIAATTTGPLKIVGNLTITDAARMNIRGNIYVTGNVTLAGDTDLVIDSSVGNKSAVIVADGNIVVGNSANVSGNGNSASYLVMLSTNTCGGLTSCGSTSAITASGAAGAVVFMAPNGRITFDGSASAKGVVGYQVSLSGATVLNYESGLSSLSFDSVGGGSSWITETWKEIYQ